MKNYEKAIRVASKENGLMIDVEVSPGSSESRITGYNEWRKRITMKVRAPPEKGKANSEVVEVIASAFGVPEASIEVVAGHTSAQKTVVIYGLGLEEARAKLDEL